MSLLSSADRFRVFLLSDAFLALGAGLGFGPLGLVLGRLVL